MNLFVNPITEKLAGRAVTYAGDALKSVYKPAKKFFKSIFGSSGAVDTLETLPKWLKSGTLEDANRLLKAKLPVRKQVTNQPKPKMVKKLQEKLMIPRTGSS